jgi:hypothetical protein
VPGLSVVSEGGLAHAALGIPPSRGFKDHRWGRPPEVCAAAQSVSARRSPAWLGTGSPESHLIVEQPVQLPDEATEHVEDARV